MVSKTRNSDYDGVRKQGRHQMVGKQRNDLIPKEKNGVSLAGDDRQVYEILLDVIEKRRQSGISTLGFLLSQIWQKTMTIWRRCVYFDQPTNFVFPSRGASVTGGDKISMYEPVHLGENKDAMIPTERKGVTLTDVERQCYESLLGVVEARQLSCTPKPQIVIITDLAKDYDDLAAMVVLKELHRLGVVELLGFIANLQPAADRARFGRGALDHLGLGNIRIATGTCGYPESESKRHRVAPYEFDDCPFMADKDDWRLKAKDSAKQLSGEDLLFELCLNAEQTGRKLTLLLISSLEDINAFSENNRRLLKSSVANIVLQGGYRVSADGQLQPLMEANNNRYDPIAAERFHTLIQDLEIKSTVYTRTAAIAATMEPKVFAELAETGNKVGEHLWTVQKAQDVSYYSNASLEDLSQRYYADRDRLYFLRTRTHLYRDHCEGDPLPIGEEVSEFTKVVVYDALAAIGVSGDDALEALNVLDSKHNDIMTTESECVRALKERHQVVGFEKKNLFEGKEVTESVSCIKAENMVATLKALLKGSLISSPLEPQTHPHSHETQRSQYFDPLSN
ncbi:hypothetical protein HYFRA_00001691 [Hymenoscyphus fraxineus]|uniref:Inosine/uridine-preferring nucleoside hydrolase domain-containing protein n=1 Tax=Hymenoscyphus fraxineus TaxID=746836 RepID=A0A9N9L630_9HELO|nr:hypothetical protein HYFRA_00001691 [Hymenoscyphus fraxineus]